MRRGVSVRINCRLLADKPCQNGKSKTHDHTMIEGNWNHFFWCSRVFFTNLALIHQTGFDDELAVFQELLPTGKRGRILWMKGKTRKKQRISRLSNSPGRFFLLLSQALLPVFGFFGDHLGNLEWSKQKCESSTNSAFAMTALTSMWPICFMNMAASMSASSSSAAYKVKRLNRRAA